MKKILLSLVFLVMTTSLLAQPQYYNWQNGGTSSNTFPFGQTAGKGVNWLFLPGAFANPTPLPAGNEITKVYFFVTTGGSRTYTNFHILMAQTTLTNLTSGSFYAGPWDTVYFNASLPQTWTSTSWSIPITLDTPYPYDPTKSLVVFVGQCGGPGSGMYIRQNTSPGGIKRVWSVGGCPFTPYAGGDASTVNFGVDVQLSVPQHYNYNTTGGPNSFPFNQGPGKRIQTLIKAGDFNQPISAPTGIITHFYVKWDKLQPHHYRLHLFH